MRGVATSLPTDGCSGHSRPQGRWSVGMAGRRLRRVQSALARSVSGLEDVGNLDRGVSVLAGWRIPHLRLCRGETVSRQLPGSLSIAPLNTDWAKKGNFWNEVKRGWRFADEDDPMVAPVPGQPNLVLRREQPGQGGGATLGLIHQGVDFQKMGIEGVQLEYFLQDRPEDFAPLREATWADWDHQGRLPTATRDGELAVCECQGTRLNWVWSEDLLDRSPIAAGPGVGGPLVIPCWKPTRRTNTTCNTLWTPRIRYSRKCAQNCGRAANAGIGCGSFFRSFRAWDTVRWHGGSQLLRWRKPWHI